MRIRKKKVGLAIYKLNSQLTSQDEFYLLTNKSNY
jgi:hypothetical protein